MRPSHLAQPRGKHQPTYRSIGQRWEDFPPSHLPRHDIQPLQNPRTCSHVNHTAKRQPAGQVLALTVIYHIPFQLHFHAAGELVPPPPFGNEHTDTHTVAHASRSAHITRSFGLPS